MDSKEDPLVKISMEDDEPDPKEEIQGNRVNQQINPQKDGNNNDQKELQQGRITRSKTNSLPQQIPRFQASMAHGQNNSGYDNTTNRQYPWAHDYLINSLKQVNIIN